MLSTKPEKQEKEKLNKIAMYSAFKPELRSELQYTLEMASE